MSFREASTVLDDFYAFVEDDLTHSLREERYRVRGLSERGRLLVVVVAAMAGDTPRILSARRATKRERHEYEDGTD